MIKVDLAEIELLTDLLVRMASDTEEALGKLRQISVDMHDDLELPLYPQTPIVLEAVSLAVQSLNRGNDTLQTLKNVILPVVDTYQENESRNRDALSRMSTAMDAAAVGYGTAMSATGITPVEHSESLISQSEVRQLVADGVRELQITNIAAVSKSVREDYEISAVADLNAPV